jgi:hypothetical protein
MLYRAKPQLVEAFLLSGGLHYVVVPEGGEPRLVPVEMFEDAFNPEPDEPFTRHPGGHRQEGAYVPLSEAGALAGSRRPTVADGIRAVVEGRALPGVPATEDDLRPASEKLADALAARTEPGGPMSHAVRVGTPEAEAAIEETRQAVDRQVAAATPIDGGIMTVQPGSRFEEVDRNTAIRQRLKAGESAPALAEEYGLSPARVYQIKLEGRKKRRGRA